MRRIAIAFLVLFGAARAQAEGIVVENHATGEVVRHVVLLLRGTTTARDGAELVVRNLDSKLPTREMSVHVRNGAFKALAELVPGANRLELACGELSASLTVRYEPPTTPNIIRFIYIVGSEGEETYESEHEDDAQDFRGKIDTAAKLFQTFCAESLADAGLPARTVRLELDEAGRVDVHVVRAPKTGGEYRAIKDGYRLYGELGDVVVKALPPASAKNIAIMSFTRFDPKARQALAHTALGGGDFGLFGSAGMFTWPSRLQDVEAAFMDARAVDGSRTHDDSAFRSTYWGLASTTLGAVFHETGHTLDLPHSVDPLDIMTRGFDRLNRVFTVVEPPARGGTKETMFALKDVARWGAISGPRLAFHRFFEQDAPKGAAGAAPTLVADFARGKIIVDAENGVRALGIDSIEAGGEALSRETMTLPDPVKKHVEFEIADLRRRAAGLKFNLVVFDGRGNRVVFGAGQLLDPAEFVRTWTFAKEARPWKDLTKLPAWTDAELADIARGEPETSSTSYVDLNTRYTPSENRIAFAWATIRVAKATKLRLLTGSDDTLRVRIDGRLVLEKFVMRGATPDSDTTEVELTAGEHTIGVECGNGGGGWGFYLRFAGADGKAWVVGADGELAPR